MIVCARCGAQNQPTNKFCLSCGAPVQQAPAAPAGQPPQQGGGYGQPPAQAWGQPGHGAPPQQHAPPGASPYAQAGQQQPPPAQQGWGAPPGQPHPGQPPQGGYAPQGPGGYGQAPAPAQGLDGGARVAGSVDVAPGTDGRLSLIWPDGKVEQYAGDLRAVWQSPTTLARVNVVDLEDYLLGVVPTEMPPSWPTAAVQAQAVAARTFAHAARMAARDRPWDICDTSACQVYGGVAPRNARRPRRRSPPPNRAMCAAGCSPWAVLPSVPCSAAPTAATACPVGAAHLPARPDDWDPATPWVREVSIECLRARHPGRGPLREVLLDRDGRGADGGRVTRMRLAFADAAVEVTGTSTQAADSALRHAFDGCGAPGEICGRRGSACRSCRPRTAASSATGRRSAARRRPWGPSSPASTPSPAGWHRTSSTVGCSGHRQPMRTRRSAPSWPASSGWAPRRRP